MIQRMLARQLRFNEAISAYDEALIRQPGWVEALDDRKKIVMLALLQQEPLSVDEQSDHAIVGDDEATGFDITDEPRSDKSKHVLPLTDMQLSERWLKSITVSPADFLRRKFAIQAQTAEEVGP